MSNAHQKVRVSVAHRYNHGLWSQERNLEVYGDEASFEGLGNNLIVEFAGDSEDARRVKKLLDHRCLYKDEPRFLEVASTLERIAQWMANELNRPVSVIEADRLKCLASPSSLEVEMSVRCRNLWLGFQVQVDSETGLGLDRREVPPIVDAVFKDFSSLRSQDEGAWGDALWKALSAKLKYLKWVTVDLGRQRTLRLADHPQQPR